MKVFIVEDSEALLQRILRSIADVPDISVVGSAPDVARALAGLEEHHPDALILDLHLPGGSGLDVLKSARPGHPGMHVMVFTNFAAEPYRRAAMDAGADEFLDKNADFPKVREILARWSAAPRASALPN
jgi:DNA-binding NarL/FixJ family response regulator